MSENDNSKSGSLNKLSSDIGLKSAPQPIQGSYEALLEDIFGLNIRSLRTIRTLFSKPSDYFQAAKTKDWAEFHYTPSPRLWLGLMALTVATQFIWGNPDNQFMEALTQQAEAGFQAGVGENADKIPPINWTEVVARSFDIALLVQPVIMLLMMLFMATFIRFWGERLAYVVRVRYLFAIIIPATVVNFLLTFLLLLLPGSVIGIISIFQLFLLIGLYTVIAAFGPFQGHPMDSRIPKSIVLALILFVGVMITNFIAQAIGITLEIIPTVREAIQAAEAAT